MMLEDSIYRLIVAIIRTPDCYSPLTTHSTSTKAKRRRRQKKIKEHALSRILNVLPLFISAIYFYTPRELFA